MVFRTFSMIVSAIVLLLFSPYLVAKDMKPKSVVQKKRIIVPSNKRSIETVRVESKAENKKIFKGDKKNIKQQIKYNLTTADREKVIKKMQRIQAEFSKAKTVKDWVNHGSKKTKLYRRQHFAKYMNEKMPKIVSGKNKILIYAEPKNKMVEVLSFSSSNQGLQTYWNGRNITARKGEAVESWHKRVFKQKDFSFYSLFIDKAYASPPTALWGPMVGSMAAGEWVDMPLDGVNGDRLLSEAEDLVNFNQLQCNGGVATFQHTLGNTKQLVAATASKDNPDYLNLQFASTTNKNQPIFSIEHRPDNDLFFLKSRALVAEGDEVFGDQFLPNLSALIDDRKLGGVGSVPTMDINTFLNNNMAYNACNTLARNGVEACADIAEPKAYLECVNTKVMGAKIQPSMSFNNPISSLSRDAGIALKAELANALAPGVITIPQGNVYPSLEYTNYNKVAIPLPYLLNAPGVNRKSLNESLGSGLKLKDGLLSSARESEVILNSCLESLQKNYQRTAECNSYVNSFADHEEKKQADRTVQELIQAMQNTSSEGFARGASSLRREIDSRPDGNQKCKDQFLNPEQLKTLNYYADLDELSGPTSLPYHLDSIIGLADAARACCTNRACESFTKGHTPNRPGSDVRSSN